MSVRNYAVLYLNGRRTRSGVVVGGATVQGGNGVLETAPHSHTGPEHTDTGVFLTSSTGEEHVVSITLASGAALTLDLSTANIFDITLTANCTITLTGAPASGVLGQWTIILRQGGVGSFTVTWAGTVDWQDTDGTGGGSAPTLYTAVGAQDTIVITTLDGGVSYGGGQERLATSYTLTVQEEGSPLATSATTLNFVGPGVTASGAGATKTITVTGTSATDTNIWRPVIDGAGLVIATGSGEALMAYGPA